MDKLKSDFAAAYGISHSELDVLMDLLPCINSNPLPNLSSVVSEECYKLRFYAAETRYGRLKAALSASLDSLVCMKEEMNLIKLNGLVDEMKLHSASEGSVALFDALNELKRMKEEVARLQDLNRALRTGIQLEAPTPMEYHVPDCIEAELKSARLQISAMDLELNRMSDKVFDYEERMREYEDVLTQMSGERVMSDGENDAIVPSRFHPMVTCANEACKAYARRLRDGMRQAVAEVCFNLFHSIHIE